MAALSGTRSFCTLALRSFHSALMPAKSPSFLASILARRWSILSNRWAIVSACLYSPMLSDALLATASAALMFLAYSAVMEAFMASTRFLISCATSTVLAGLPGSSAFNFSCRASQSFLAILSSSSSMILYMVFRGLFLASLPVIFFRFACRSVNWPMAV